MSMAVEVDSTERKDIPPFGDLVDYLTFRRHVPRCSDSSGK